MKKQLLLIALLGGIFHLNADPASADKAPAEPAPEEVSQEAAQGAAQEVASERFKRFDIRNYPWNAVSWGLIAGLGYKAYTNRSKSYNLFEDDEHSFYYTTLGIAGMCAVSAARGLYSLAFPPTKKIELVEVDSFTELVDELGYAIDDSNPALVAQLLEQFDGQELASERRQQILQSMANHTTAVLNKQKKKFNLVRSWRDSASVGIGVYLLSYLGDLNLSFLRIGDYKNPTLTDGEKSKMDISLLKGLALSALGGYVLYKGLTCGSQQWHLEDALAIQVMIALRIAQGLEKAISEAE